MTAERSDAAATFDAERPQSLRGFVAIKIAAETADEFAQLTRSLDRSGVQLIGPGDIHLALVPPWNEVSISGSRREASSRRGRVCLLAARHREFAANDSRR